MDRYESALQNIRLYLLKGEVVQAFDKVEDVLLDMEQRKSLSERDDFHTVKRQRNFSKQSRVVR